MKNDEEHVARIIGAKIHAGRLALGLSMVEFGALLGVSDAAVSHWESTTPKPGRQKSAPTPAKLAKIADLFGTSVDDLLGRAPHAVMLRSAREAELLDLFRAMDGAQQIAYINLCKARTRR